MSAPLMEKEDYGG